MTPQKSTSRAVLAAAALLLFWLGNRMGGIYQTTNGTVTQKLAAALADGGPLYYWATMTPHDGEDEERIQRHRDDRAGMGFTTVERSFSLPDGLTAIAPAGTVLFDSVTACLSEQMFPYGGEMDAQTLRSLMRFRENRDLHFDDITPQFALAYETWLREQRLCRNSSSFYLRVVRTLYNKAVAAGLTPDRQPFHAVYTGIDKTTKRAVGMADIRRIKEADLRAAPRMEFARDMFLLSFYLRGIAPVDLAFLRKTDISQGYLAYARHKTGQRMRVLVEPEIQRLFDKYAAPGTKFLLPLITKEDGTERNQYRNSTRNINRHLKRLSARLHLSAPLTLYVARHSWASIAQSEHIPIGVICGAMGHDSETTTQIYLASIQTQQIDEANNLLISRL